MNLNYESVVYPEAQFYYVDTSIYWLKKIITFNNIVLDDFIKCVASVLDKSEMKLNGLCLCGPSNAGKSLVCNIVESARFCANIIEFDERIYPLDYFRTLNGRQIKKVSRRC